MGEMKNEGYILIVEDTRTQALQIESIIRQLGFPTKVAYSAKEALSAIGQRRPILVVSDILMPEMDGYELCKFIKSDEKLRDVTVVLLTQLSDPKEIIRGLECGADDFIVKPYNEDFLLTRIRAVLSVKAKQDESARQSRVLVVEDSPTQAEQLKFLLEEKGYMVNVAANGREGIEAARRLKPTVVISDILMPEMDGYELAYEIKHDPELKKTPVILVTSLMDRKDVVRRAAVVADGFFTKPYDDRYLLEKLRHLLSASRERDEVGLDAIKVSFGGEDYRISSGRRQILTFLLSTYENAVQQNRDLILMQKELQALNEELEDRVAERTRRLQASEANFRKLLETSSDATVVVGRGGSVYFANKAAEALLGGSAQDGKINWNGFGFNLKPGEIRDIEISRPDGTRTVAEARAAGTTWGEEEALLATLRDMTERRRMEAALRESEENFRAIAENANDGILIKAGTEIVYANRRIAEMTGYSTGEILSGVLKDSPDKLSEALKLYRQMVEGSPRPRQYETSLSKKDGSPVPVEITTSATLWHGTGATVVIIRDISERKRREEELFLTSKLESLGTLAGGIAHDFNNLLTAVVGNASLAKVLIDPQDRVYKMICDLEKASLRAKDLTQQLLTFAKGGSPVKKTASIAELIRDSAGFALTGSRIGCAFSIDGELWPLEVDEGQISQVIHNLIINAEQAMPEGGQVRVLAENVRVAPGNPYALKEGRYVRLSFRDTGIGIPEKNLSRIFDPYFTTKETGTGLGLATVYSIIRNHDGHISVESKPGQGTTFNIYLPASEKPVEAGSGKRFYGEDNPVFGTGRILVMDDEEIVREAAGMLLTEMGYEVEFARDGREAVEMYRAAIQKGSPFGAVLMDITIPGGMGGKDTIKKLLEIDPDVRGIVSSGYSDDSIMSDYRKYGFSAVIAKPYRVGELSKTVSDVMKPRG